MKDSKFIELLNLYVDHQISSSDAALLEAEIQRDPERRRIYRQYCQMQKACVVLADNFRSEAPVGGRIVDFPTTRRSLASVTYAVGALAAAACVALVMVQRRPVAPPAPIEIAATPAPVAVQPNTTDPRNAPMPLPARVALQPAFAGLVHDDSAAGLALTNSERVPLEWMTRVQLQRVPTEELWFETRPTFQPQDLSFPSRRTFQGQTEMTAFRFQR